MGVFADLERKIWPRKSLERLYRQWYNQPLRLATPQLFSEHIQAYKLFYRDPRLPMLSDKVEAKRVIARLLGPEWVTPSLYEAEWFPAERRWPAPYVIKANQRSGGNIFVRADEQPDWSDIEHKFRRWLRKPHGIELHEWAYSSIPPRILIEPFIANLEHIIDYKFFVFGGRVAFIQVHTDRFVDQKNAFYDTDWRLTPYGIKWPRDIRPLPRPGSLKTMIEASEIIGRDLPFVRVDLYEIDGHPRFGEATFYPDSGLCKFDPPETDAVLGRCWPDHHLKEASASASLSPVSVTEMG